MPRTLDELHQRLDAAEREIAELRREIEEVEDATLGPLEAWQRRRAAEVRREKEAARPALQRAFREMGIPWDLPAVGAKRLREMMLAEGVRPEECLASKEIERMREE